MTRLVLFGLAGLVTIFCGCPSSSEAPSNAGESPDNTSADGKASIIRPSYSTSAESPAKVKEPDQLSPNSSPEQVCRRFLSALQNEDRISAEQLLTKKSIVETRRAGLDLSAPGGPSAVYTVGQAQYATSKQEIAHVPCNVEEIQSGETVLYTLVWVFKRQDTGWKICGMFMQPREGQSEDLLSFENSIDISRIKLALSTSDSEQTRQASRAEPESRK